MATQVQGFPKCPCGNTQRSPCQNAGSEIVNGLAGIYFIVGQQPSSPRRLMDTNVSLAPTPPPVASARTSCTTSSSGTARPPPPPPINPGPPPPPILPTFSEDSEDDCSSFNPGSAIKGFFAAGGLAKLRPASERKLGPVPKRKPRTSRTPAQAIPKSPNDLTPVPSSTIQGPSQNSKGGGGGGDDKVFNVDSGTDHVELLTNALTTFRPVVQDSDEDSEGDNEWNEE